MARPVTARGSSHARPAGGVAARRGRANVMGRRRRAGFVQYKPSRDLGPRPREVQLPSNDATPGVDSGAGGPRRYYGKGTPLVVGGTGDGPDAAPRVPTVAPRQSSVSGAATLQLSRRSAG